MNIIEKLPWYADCYFLIPEGVRLAQDEIEKLENPEKELKTIKKFYQSIGADYTKNEWIMQTDANISETNRGEDSKLNQLKTRVIIGNALQSAVERQDDESLRILRNYRNDEQYKKIINQIWFYIGISKVKTEPDYIEHAYNQGLSMRYPLNNVFLFINEGGFYYIYYFQCLQELIKKCKTENSLNSKIVEQINDRCFNANLMFQKYSDSANEKLANIISLILSEISAVQKLLNQSENNI